MTRVPTCEASILLTDDELECLDHHSAGQEITEYCEAAAGHELPHRALCQLVGDDGALWIVWGPERREMRVYGYDEDDSAEFAPAPERLPDEPDEQEEQEERGGLFWGPAYH